MSTIPTPRFQACANRAIQTSLGKPWVALAKGPDAFDCWGFVEYVYEQGGITFPPFAVFGTNSERVARGIDEIANKVVKNVGRVPYSIVLMGDSNGMGHLGIYHPSGMVYHCLERQGVVGHTPEMLRGVFACLEYWSLK